MGSFLFLSLLFLALISVHPVLFHGGFLFSTYEWEFYMHGIFILRGFLQGFLGGFTARSTELLSILSTTEAVTLLHSCRVACL
ncbi:uncharacterized protein BDZ99DRAFT_144554 [Mytilinidion resinicola]|uniref:Uncharacterized protein n=1 Tax=Mytilinidion resinicola TaxID=574789 RepID=A0A6A6YA43_9PEZI|nr:uncharacterized protein BDZ99DRAFT_144554 [Mytilinidion resinicola]KAF2804864.1 hypothetical protein BDZ99DRAFT_144554 [Mytilinidion resinicola]